MRRLTIVLTDEEYGDLERRALADRRSVRQMAERLVTQKPALGIGGADWTWRPQTTPYIPTVISSPNTCDVTVTNDTASVGNLRVV